MATLLDKVRKIRVFREGGAAAGDEAQVYVLDLVTHIMCGSFSPHPTLIPSTIKIKLLRMSKASLKRRES